MPSLTAVRSLAAAGFRVIAGDGGEYATVRYSRSCHELWKHPPASRGDALISALLALLERRPEIDVVLPLRPDYVGLLALARDRLPQRVVIATPDASVVLTCLDKERMYEVAREAGAPYRPHAVADDIEQLQRALDDVGFPCVVRPARDASGRLPGDRKAIVCRAASDLASALPTWPAGHATLVIQPFVSGPRHNVSFAARDGVILHRIEIKTVRSDRTDGMGLGVELMSMPLDPRLLRYCDALVGRLGYSGVGTAQFLVPRDGEPHFLELNPRIGLALPHVTWLGLDMTLAAIELASGGGLWHPDPGRPYAVSRRFAWTSRDLYGLGSAIVRGELSRGQRLRWLRSAARTALRADMHLTWSLTDPLPTLAAWGHLARPSTWSRLRERS
jgi:predicted ATP-grasp superfamily ATP-dependent carboligase